jgi:DNA-binding response OmpR family regulator
MSGHHPRADPSIKKYTILLVDDELEARKKMRSVLREAGYHVLEAHDFQQGLATYHMRHADIHLLLIDVSIPGNNGCELALSAIAIDPAVKILLMSGLTGAEVCKFYGIPATDVHFLEKPFPDSALLARVKYVLGSSDPLTGTAAESASG